MNACQANCNQGRNQCPAPDACQLPDTDPCDWLTPARFWAIYAIAIVCALIGGTAWGLK
jgi:hypothetical protein